MMIFCCVCHKRILPDDDYVQDLEKSICSDCIVDYIEDRYDIFDIAEELGMSVLTAPDDDLFEMSEENEPLPGQIDMFGGVVGDA